MLTAATMLTMLLFLLTLVVPGLGFQQASKVQDLAGFPLPSPKIRINHAMQTIIMTMNQVEKLPSCQKIASQALLNSCSDIDHASNTASDKGIDGILERSKSIYAARLAICELIDANADIPASCSPFRPFDHVSKGSAFRGFIPYNRPTKPTAQDAYNDKTNQYLDQCSLALSSKPQWWTSYSNARQNAVLMCHSMRAELDKDDMIHKMKLMFDAGMEAASTMSETTEEFRVFVENWGEMGKGMESFHVALNSDLEIQRKITEQWAQFHANLQKLDNNIQDLGRDINLAREVSSQITSELDTHRVQTQAAQAGVTHHLERVQDISLKLYQSQDASLSNSLSLAQQSEEITASMARNLRISEELRQQTHLLVDAILFITENATDAARTLSEFQRDITNLPTTILYQLFEGSVERLPFGPYSFVIFFVTWCLVFATLGEWRAFRKTSAAVASLGLSVAITYVFHPIVQVLIMFDLCNLETLGIISIVLVAAFACSIWYRQQRGPKPATDRNQPDPETKEMKTQLPCYATPLDALA